MASRTWEKNPTDIACRGIHFCELDCDSLWSSGPDILKQSVDLWPQIVEYKDLAVISVEQRKVTHVVEVATQSEVLEIENFGT